MTIEHSRFQETPRIDTILNSGQPTMSFEFFPPKTPRGETLLLQAIEELRSLQPDFVSITRTGSGTQSTLDLTAQVQNQLGIRAMAHLTCVHHTRAEMGEALDTLWEKGVRNVLVLRGDLPTGVNAVESGNERFEYASDLVPFVRDRHDFCIGVAGYPEGHPQCLNLTRDLETLKQKVDEGAHFIITQLFFDNEDFYRWRDQVSQIGIDVPIIAGIMPINNLPQIKRFVTLCGAKIPHPLLLALEKLESDPAAVHDAGMEHAALQCEGLIAAGVDGLHFYTLNRSQATVRIGERLRIERA